MQGVNDLEIAKKMISIAKSASDRGIEYNLSFIKMKELMDAERCYYTGVVFEDSGDKMRSIDRVDNSKGYIDNNVVACTVYFNSLKKNLSLDEIKLLFEKVFNFVNAKKNEKIANIHATHTDDSVRGDEVKNGNGRSRRVSSGRHRKGKGDNIQD